MLYSEQTFHFVINNEEFAEAVCRDNRWKNPTTSSIHGVSCQKCMKTAIFEAHCARQEVKIWTDEDGTRLLNSRQKEQQFANIQARGAAQFGVSRFRFEANEVRMTIAGFEDLVMAAVRNATGKFPGGPCHLAKAPAVRDCGTCSYCDPARPMSPRQFKHPHPLNSSGDTITIPIAPFGFTAIREDAPHDEATPDLECFNAGVSEAAIAQLTAPLKSSRLFWVAGFIVMAGLAPAAAAVILVIGSLVIFKTYDVIPEVLGVMAMAGFALAGLGTLWIRFLMSPKRRGAKAWKKALSDAWFAHGSEIIVLKRLQNATRVQVTDDLTALEEIRRGLNRIEPSGDELDDARDALLRYIEASDIPVLGKRAALATHIKDRAVRQAAKEYAQAVDRQRWCRQRLDAAIGLARDLLTSRRQARSDAELIRLVNAR